MAHYSSRSVGRKYLAFATTQRHFTDGRRNCRQRVMDQEGEKKGSNPRFMPHLHCSLGPWPWVWHSFPLLMDGLEVLAPPSTSWCWCEKPGRMLWSWEEPDLCYYVTQMLRGNISQHCKALAVQSHRPGFGLQLCRFLDVWSWTSDCSTRSRRYLWKSWVVAF